MHGSRLSGARDPVAAHTWSFEPLQIVPTVIVGVLYARRARRSPGAGRPVPAFRQAMFWTGIALVVLALNSPVDQLGEDRLLLRAHAAARPDRRPGAACFVLGLTGPILRPVLAIPFVDRLRVLAHPFVALPLWAVNLYIWHIPFLYEAALHHSAVHALEHFCFFTCGCLMWAPVVETLPAPVGSAPARSSATSSSCG